MNADGPVGWEVRRSHYSRKAGMVAGQRSPGPLRTPARQLNAAGLTEPSPSLPGAGGARRRQNPLPLLVSACIP
jgi:hypothetical protein